MTAAEGAHHPFAVLATLDAFGACSQAELCRRTDLDRNDMNAVINPLEAEGAVTRVPDPGNRRQNIVEIGSTIISRPLSRPMESARRMGRVSRETNRFYLGNRALFPERILIRVDIHRVQMNALTMDSMDMKARGVCS